MTGPQSCWNFITVSSNFRLCKIIWPSASPMAATSIAGDWRNIKLYYSRYVYTNTNYVIISNCLAELLTIWFILFLNLFCMCFLLLFFFALKIICIYWNDCCHEFIFLLRSEWVSNCCLTQCHWVQHNKVRLCTRSKF